MSGRLQLPRRPGRNPRRRSRGLAKLENENQYRVTQRQAEKLERALQQLAAQPPDNAAGQSLRPLEEAGLRGQLNDLRAQLAEYESRSALQQAIVRIVAILRGFGAALPTRGQSGN
jgi:hypothetical protein